MVVLYQSETGHLLVLNPDNLQEIQNIDLEKSAWPSLLPKIPGIHAHVYDVQLDYRGDRAAIALSWGVESGGELRVYDLKSGRLLNKWDFQKVSVGQISIDSDGRRVAVPIMREESFRSSERNLFIFDVDSSKEIMEINTGYVAGVVRFAGPDTVATVSNELGLGSHRKDGIRFWDIKTGRLVREIRSAPEGVRYRLELSGDGQVIAGYVGKQVSHWWWFDPASFYTEYDRFRVWNLATGKVIATSPDLDSLFRFNFRLSRRGDLVLGYPVNTGGPLRFYELQ
jgi:WD40 repeat protein